MRRIAVLSALMLLCGVWFDCAAQESGSQTTKLLTLKKAQLVLEKAKRDFGRSLRLKEEGLTSEEDFAGVETAYLQARVDYQQSLIDFLGSEARVSVTSAAKFQDTRGRKFVKVCLRYSSKELGELTKSDIASEDLFPLDLMKEIRDVSVSLKFDGKIISDPYEKVITSFPIGSVRTATFELLKDVESLDVSVFYAGKTETTPVYLQKGLSANLVTLSSAQFSQEADLDSQTAYEISLEKFSGEADVFKLDVVNLPSQLSYEFCDPQSGARLSQIKFTEGVTSMKLSLRVSLPRNADVVTGNAIEFYALVLDNDQAAQLQALREKEKRIGAPLISALKAGSVRLELIPRGVGRIEVQAANLYHEVRAGDEVLLGIRVKNAGTRPLNNIRILTEHPPNWRSQITPDLLGALGQSKEESVTVRLIPPADVPVGDYEAKIRAECSADNRDVESEDKKLRIHVASRTNLLGVSLLVLVLFGLLGGTAIIGMKLARR